MNHIKEDIMKIREVFTCPVELIIDMISGKWKTIILWRLRLGTQRYTELYRDIKGINEKMFIEHITELVDCGFVSRASNNSYPPVVTYTLTPLGEDILRGLEIFQKVGQELLAQGTYFKNEVDKEA